jgi:hypothetical protein
MTVGVMVGKFLRMTKKDEKREILLSDKGKSATIDSDDFG